MLLDCQLYADGYDQYLLKNSIGPILQTNELCSMATVDNTLPYINTAYFAYTNDLTIYFLSNPSRQHSLNLASNPAISLSIFNGTQPFASLAQGLQIFGKCWLTKEANARKAFDVYSKRFPKLLQEVPCFEDYEAGVIQSRLYELRATNVKIFDEPSFGKGIWVVVSVNDHSKKLDGVASEV
jgi:uncharacterized protein YhbP (UPF0306 family)